MMTDVTEKSDDMNEDNINTSQENAELREQIIAALQSVYDPEIPINIYELGLIYEIHISAENDVVIHMTLTTPACPQAQILPAEVERKVMEVEKVNSANVLLVWDPPWSQERMSEAARLQLGLI
jgi:FeS assembly SUF system protein